MNSFKSRFVLLLAGLLFCFPLFAQNSKDSTRNFKPTFVGFTHLGIASVTAISLNYAWYKPYSTGKFHFFNDNGEWLQMDKVGHFTSVYVVTSQLTSHYQWAGWNLEKSAAVSAAISLGFLTTMEIMDGYSAGWGFSWGDMVANSSGALLYSGQQVLFGKSLFNVKFSFYPEPFYQYRPNLLGSGYPERLIKDYNSQNYWVCFSPFSFGKSAKYAWLCLALGYSATGLTGGFSNVWAGGAQPVPDYMRSRQFLLSADIDLTKLPVKNKFLKKVCSTLNILKVPFPTIGVDKFGVKGYLVQ